jgi:bifunctional lysine-specific demethylase and histidyl-hydroxylase NO66
MTKSRSETSPKRAETDRPTPTTRTAWIRIPTTPTRIAPTRTPTQQIQAKSSALERSIDPVSTEEFLAEYWEERPLVVARAEEGRYNDLLSVADVERLLCSGGLRTPGFRLVKAGEKLDPASYTKSIPWRPSPFSGMAEVGQVLGEFEGGATLVLQGLHHTWPPLAEFCRFLEIELGHPAQANAYFTPRDAQGLPVHHDTHDVFSLQVAGEKRWLVYEPVLELPLKDQKYGPELGEPANPIHDVTLSGGDTLYLPRGWLHQAMTSSTDSLHITVGINVYTWLDAFKAALSECEDEVGFRRSPEGGAHDLLETLRARLDPDEVSTRRRRKLVATRRPVLPDQLTQLQALQRLTLETLVERRPTVLFDLEDSTLLFEGKQVALPAVARDDLEFIASADEAFTAADLPGDLDDETRLVLVRRLVREGFLRLRESAPDDGMAAGE